MEKLLREAVARWRLSDLTPVSSQGPNTLYTAQSTRFGAVVLKLSHDRAALSREYEALCRMGAAVPVLDHFSGALLEKRVLPGTRLRDENDPKTRVLALKAVFAELHRYAEDGESYLDWLEKALERCQTPSWRKRGAAALKICREIYEKYPERVLLHGDLHHDNLLLTESGGYMAVDPKGVLGPRILDLPRFLLNEIGGGKAHMGRMLRLMEQSFGYPGEDLGALLFMEAALANLWLLEDGLSPMEMEMEMTEMLMEEQELLARWKGEEAIAHIHGWDFSHISDRYTEEEDLPWDYGREILGCLTPDITLLDIDTGGGEFLLSLNHPPEKCAATEGYGPNVALCRETLLPLGVDFREADGKGHLPFPDKRFHMVIDRHGDLNPREIFRVLKPGGLFITQQVGAENDRELVELLMGQVPLPFPEQYLALTEEKFREAGFEILKGEECFRPIRFYDVGALVWFARIIEWEFPGFSVETHREALFHAQQLLERDGAVEGRIHRFLLIARKPGEKKNGCKHAPEGSIRPEGTPQPPRRGDFTHPKDEFHRGLLHDAAAPCFSQSIFSRAISRARWVACIWISSREPSNRCCSTTVSPWA